MTDDQKKSGRKYEGSAAADKPKTGQATSTAPTEQAQTTSRPAETSPELAAKEFAQILMLLSLTGVQRKFLTAQERCKKPPKWCLPDVSCTARVTLTQDAIAAFKNNREFCQPKIK